VAAESIDWIEGELPTRQNPSDLKREVEDLIEALQERPGVWAKVASFPDDPEKSHRKRAGLMKYAPAELEIRVFMPDVFARYVEVT